MFIEQKEIQGVANILEMETEAGRDVLPDIRKYLKSLQKKKFLTFRIENVNGKIKFRVEINLEAIAIDLVQKGIEEIIGNR